MAQKPLLELPRGAEFSPCRTWRYALWRRWDDRGPWCAFIGLNPSTADETQNDPTIRRCIGFAQQWGFGGLWMLNLYGYRATDPRDMQAAADPVGPGNDETLVRIAGDQATVPLVLAAWGVNATLDRERHVCELLGRPVECLGTSRDGRPLHPLYRPAATPRQVFYTPGEA